MKLRQLKSPTDNPKVSRTIWLMLGKFDSIRMSWDIPILGNGTQTMAKTVYDTFTGLL